MKRDINSGHSRRKWKWLKIIFGFLGGREMNTERKAHGSKRKKKIIELKEGWGD